MLRCIKLSAQSHESCKLTRCRCTLNTVSGHESSLRGLRSGPSACMFLVTAKQKVLKVRFTLRTALCPVLQGSVYIRYLGGTYVQRF